MIKYIKGRKFILKTCEICDDEYYSRSDKKSKYCSRKCAGIAKSLQPRIKPKYCPHCEELFQPRRSVQKYCSSECATEGSKKRTIINCEYCGIEFERNDCHISDNNFCSRECSGNWSSENILGNLSPNWNGGIYKPNGKYIFILQEDGSYKQEHRIVMENEIGRLLKSSEIIHHIDGDGLNNDISNLEIMTRAEHARLHTTDRWENGDFF